MANIRELKDKKGKVSSYQIRVYKGRDISGKQLKPYIMTWKPSANMTQKQIEKELTRQATLFEEECKKGITGNATKITLALFCSQYLSIKKESLSPSTFEFYERTINRFIIPALGHLKIQDIKPAHIQTFLKELYNKPCETKSIKSYDEEKTLSPSSVKRYLTVLQSIFKQAYKLGIISSNPADAEKLSLQKSVSPKIEIFTKQEATQMLECLANEELQFQVLIQLAIITGARRGELVALKFSDFNIDTKKVTIERSAVKLIGQDTIIKPPKDYEVRSVAVTPYIFDLLDMLKAEKEKEAERLGSYWNNGDWLFTQLN